MLHLGDCSPPRPYLEEKLRRVFVTHKTRENWAENLTILTDPNFIRKDAHRANKPLKKLLGIQI